MSVTAVLRFRDFEAETVPVHREIISQSGAAWWAWWRKESEDSQLDELAQLARACPVTIGLINRQLDTRFVAYCTRIAYSPEGGSLLSPEPHRTPSYYREDSFPAWFLLSAIEQVDQGEWNRRFGAVPAGEPTLFLVPTQAADARKILARQFTTEPIGIRSPVILHLSDLHFGSDYGFPLQPREVPTLRQTLDEAIEAGLERVGSPPVGIVVISGDITTRGENEGFLEAQTFIERLLGRLRLTPEQLVLVPGNHDILLDDSHMTRSYAAERPFRNFLQLVYGRDGLELNRLHWFATNDGRDLLVLALNSVRPRAQSTMEYGYVGRDLYGPLLKELSELMAQLRSHGERPLAVAVLHHHVLPTPLVEDPDTERPVSLTLDAGQLIEDLQQAGVSTVLHGHQHVPFIGSTSRAARDSKGRWSLDRAVHIIGGGSCSVKVDRLWNQMRDNCLGVYGLSDTGLDVNMFQFAPGVEFRESMRVVVPLHDA
ncbi:metallophosphoesterase [Micromonospora sp. WMMD998]|uniref:metallophosphoesterase family protein n=1 Tax=Micromonospora sp. WMMD998 TaxID=3016092 RepID=UPI00249A5C9F|nr:metallophosphoesterase [Micromonospora sp. WMMD998]WFE37297.1 metallophosphoesterase [Micromonospora sp. WMMD998]